MRYIVIINDDERRGNGEESTTAEVAEEVDELLRSGYFFVETVREFSRESHAG